MKAVDTPGGPHHIAEAGDEIKMGKFIVAINAEGELYVVCGIRDKMVLEPESTREVRMRAVGRRA